MASRAGRISILAALAALLFLAGCVAPVSPAPRVNPVGLTPAQAGQAERNLRVFDTVWDTVSRRYYDPQLHGVDWRAAAVTHGPSAASAADETALYQEINGMLRLLEDGHTGALGPQQARNFRDQQVVVTGFLLRRVDQRWVVDEVMPGSPAEAAGVQPGWIVFSRNGRTLGEQLDLPVLRGGEVIHWVFLDAGGRQIAMTLTASLVSTAREESRLLPGGVVYLRFDDFDWATMRWLSRQLKEHRKAPAVVIDLRHNLGGSVLALDFVAGEFFNQGFDYAVMVDRSGHHRNLQVLMFGSAHYRGRVAVLVDRLSASAAEILAATLQERHRATVIGRKTSGYVLFARMRSLPDGGMLEWSEDDLRTMQGRRLEGNGVTPDVETPPATVDDLRAGRDPDLDAALRILRQP
jgi:carboxyl-terminal processing protease